MVYYVMIVKNGFTYQFMFKYDGVLFNREWYSINCSTSTDLDLYKMILHSLTGCMYVAVIATWLAVGFVCLLHTMLLYIAIQLYNN